jgi:tryptophan synthase alpha chain
MSQVAERLQLLRASGRKALLPFFTAGYPNQTTFVELLRASAAAGADVIEVGLPFSDPLADGPTIQLSSQLALSKGTTIQTTFESLSQQASQAVPLVAMTYVNPVLALGPERFAQAARRAGISSVVLPDLPLGEEGRIGTALFDYGIDLIRLVAPTTREARLERICAAASAFIYLVSVAGVTGARQSLATDLPALVARIRRHTHLPVLIGFGISTPAQAAEAAAIADGVIVGSVLVERITQAASESEAVKSVAGLLAAMRNAIDTATTVVAQGVRQ